MNHFLEMFTYAGIVFRPMYVGLMLLGLWLGLSRAGWVGGERTRYFLVIAIPAIAWLVAIWVFALHGGFLPAPGKGNPLLPIAIFGSVGLWIAFLRRSSVIDEVLASIPPSWLIGIQTYRILGIAFLAQWMLGNISPAFAFPAGLGDVLTGILAPLAAIMAARSGTGKTVGLLWNALGILDLVSAVTLGTLNGAGFLPPAANALAPPLGAYPLVMVAAYTVPLSFILHFLSIRQLVQLKRTKSDVSALTSETKAVRA
ncbi:hypothetical protein ACVINW_001388 [Bradyrhizobium sp. USDA 4461]